MGHLSYLEYDRYKRIFTLIALSANLNKNYETVSLMDISCC